MRRIFPVLMVLPLLGLGGCDGGTSAPKGPATPLAVAKGCNPIASACDATGKGITMQLHLGPGVKPLQPFPLKLTVKGVEAADSSVQADFGMVGMDMGINRYQLQPVAGNPGQWQGRITLPVCTAGRQDWIATVTLTTPKGRYVARYAFSSHK